VSALSQGFNDRLLPPVGGDLGTRPRAGRSIHIALHG